MGGKFPIDELPSGIRYYLLNWKDNNLSEFSSKYNVFSLRQLTYDQIHELFSYVTTKDGALIAREAANHPTPQP